MLGYMFVCVISDIVHLLCCEGEGVCSIGCTCGGATCGSLGGMTWVQLWWFEVVPHVVDSAASNEHTLCH